MTPEMKAALASADEDGVLLRSRVGDFWRASNSDNVIANSTVAALVQAGRMSYTVYVDNGKRFPVEASVSVRVKD